MSIMLHASRPTGTTKCLRIGVSAGTNAGCGWLFRPVGLRGRVVLGAAYLEEDPRHIGFLGEEEHLP
jgi:hypothetical protein